MTHAILESPADCARCHSRHFGKITYPHTDTGCICRPDWNGHDHTTAQDATIAQAVRAAAGGENPVVWVLEGSSGYLSVANSKISAISNAIAAELRKLGNASPTT